MERAKAVASIHVTPTFQGATQGELIGKFQASSGWKAVSNSSDFEARSGEAFGEIKAGGVALNVGSQRDDDFLDRLPPQPLFQRSDMKVIRFDAIQRGDFSAEDVIFAAVGARFFDADDIDRPFHQADEGRIASRIGADVALGFLRQGSANVAGTHLIARVENGFGEVAHGPGLGLDEVQSEPFGGSRADPGQLIQGGDKRRKSFRQCGHGLKAA
jgi:hypothetical protein